MARQKANFGKDVNFSEKKMKIFGFRTIIFFSDLLVSLKLVLALGEFGQLASFVSLKVVLTLGEFGQLANFVSLKVVLALGEFGWS